MAPISERFVTRDALQEWLLDFHAASKTLNAEVFSMYFARDAEVQYANNPVSQGRDAIQEAFAFAFDKLDIMTHNIVYFDFIAEPESRLYQAADIKYVVKGDDTETDVINIPAMMSGTLTVEDGSLKFKRCEIYLDASKVFGRMAEKGLLP